MSEAAPPGATAEPLPVQDWQRLNPLMLLVHPVTEIFRFLPLVIGSFFFGASTGGGLPWQWIGVAIPVALGLARFVTTKYRITPTQIELHRGLLAKRVLTAPLDRVRTIELTASPIHRILGLSKVQVGTGGASRAGEERLELDALATGDARVLRTSLLHRGQLAEAATGTAETGLRAGPVTDEQVLLELDPSWARFAPLTSSGFVIAAAVLAGLSQLTEGVSVDLEDSALPDPGALPLSVLIPLGVAGAVLGFSVLAVLGYLVTNWGFRLTTDPARRSFRVARGLVTTKETSLEAERIRGLELHEPFGLRLAGAARLNAAATGLERSSGGVRPLVPAAPRQVVDAVAVDLLGDQEAVHHRLVQHGSLARRRRYLRALAGTLPLIGLLALPIIGADWPVSLLLLVPLLFVAAVFLARDRYARLGHHLTDRFLVVRSGTFRGRRDILERSGVIGWTLQQSWFQRRAGLVDLVATTSAGKQAYTAYDVPEGVAIALAEEAVPGLLEQFREPAISR